MGFYKPHIIMYSWKITYHTIQGIWKKATQYSNVKDKPGGRKIATKPNFLT